MFVKNKETKINRDTLLKSNHVSVLYVYYEV